MIECLNYIEDGIGNEDVFLVGFWWLNGCVKFK